MEAKQYALIDAAEIHKFFRAFRPHPPIGWWFRGQADDSWKLLPKAGRTTYYLPGVQPLGRFNYWTEQAVAYLPDLPTNDWERLAVAQHYGLATCLLDWTFNPLVALYFACSELPAVDGAVYCYEPLAFVNDKTLPLTETQCNGVGFVPRAISARILNQKAVFTVHLPPDDPLRVEESAVLKGEPNLSKLLIPSAHKSEILKMLDDYGINRVTLFPDLEGLSAHVNWETMKIVESNAKRRG